MGREVERKFLLLNADWRQQADSGTAYVQGYLVGSKQASVRVRIEGDQARLNIKSATLGITRQEYEYSIPVEDARQMLNDLCDKPLISKTRYHVRHESHLWEIDEFDGDNQGLIVAEIELEHPDESFTKPAWLGREVSDDPRYYNVSLVSHPYREWS